MVLARLPRMMDRVLMKKLARAMHFLARKVHGVRFGCPRL